MAVLAMALLAVPPTEAWAARRPHGKTWVPPDTPLGGGTRSVAGGNQVVSGPRPAAYPQPKQWQPAVATAPVAAATATVVLGADSAEARAAAAATGGGSPASAGLSAVPAGSSAVTLAQAADDTSTAHPVKVALAGPAGSKAAGVAGPLLTLTDADTGGPGHKVVVNLDLPALGDGLWADRAHLVQLPACALTTPDLAQCRQQTPLQSQLDPGSGTLSAEVALPQPAADHPAAAAGSAGAATAPAAAPMVLAATSGPAGSGGSYAATSLSPSASWGAGSNLGDFTYSYPIQLPGGLGGKAPAVALSYDSSAVDGMTSSTNSQSSWVGDGWSYSPGFIERSYKGCSKDGITNSGDLCWGGQNATLSLGGHSGTLVRDDATGVWHLQSDDGSKIEQLTGAPNGLNNGEYWKVTTGDGTQYWFGLDHLPGGDGTDPATNSAWGEPVYSPNSGDPCYSSTAGQGSWCTMGWRWNLDYVVDTHQNLLTYSYATETNNYSRGGGQNGGSGTLTSYVRGGYPTQIAYGQRLPEQVAAHGSVNPAVKVVFATAERCLPSGTITCAEDQRTTANAAYWPDVPLDQLCTTTCANTSPSFFTTKRLAGISTQVLVGSAYRTVDSWALTHSLPDPGDGTKPTLWLSSIQRTGSDGQPAQTLPAVSFAARELPNRVDGLVPAEPVFNRPRIQQITTETGGQINVVYSQPQCSRVNNTMPASEDGNTMACLPVHWYLPGSSSTDPVHDWFNKFTVTDVTEQDAVTGSLVKDTHYTYAGGAAWHRDDAEFTDPKTRTWDGFRGYQSVTTTTGSGFTGEAPRTQQTVTYLRGMDGDVKADGSEPGVSVPDPLGGSVTDSDWLAGTELATQEYDQAGGQVVAMSGSTSNGQQTTATHQQSGGMPPLVARYPASQLTSVSKEKLSNGSWRTSTTVAGSDPAHGNRETQVDDKGDGTAATPEICTTDSYATSAADPMLLTLLSEKKSVTGPCGTTATSANTQSDVRSIYDGQPFGQAGALAETTSSELLDHYDGSGNPVFANSARATFDLYGRPATVSEGDGSTYGASGSRLTGPDPAAPAATSATSYTPATGALPTRVTLTGPMGASWATTVDQDPGRGLPLVSTDANGHATTEQYDGLGRLAAVWLPQQATGKNPNFKYSYAINGLTGPSVVTSQTLNEDSTYSYTNQLYDGLGRLRQTQATSPTAASGRLISDVGYDSHGWEVKEAGPYYEKTSFPNSTIFLPQDSQVPSETWLTYDGRGQVVNSAFMSYAQLQWSTSTAYPGADRTDTTPPAGGSATSTFTDARGNTTALWQYHGGTPTGNAGDADVTSYTYTPSGQAATRTDAAGNTWSYGYDLMGRQTSQSDPDTGTSRTYYDVNSRIDHTVDAKGNTLAYTYDILGRKTAMYSGSVAPANELASWSYDTLAKGKPTGSTRYVGGAGGAAYSQALTGYDAAYRPQGSTVTIPAVEGALAGTYTTGYGYNNILGTLDHTDLPAMGGLPAETVSNVYDTSGNLQNSWGNDTLVHDVQYDAFGDPVRTTLGDYGTQVVSTQVYDAATGSVLSSFLDRQAGTSSVDQTNYTYDPSGQITSATDLQNASARDTQCYTYDYLGRLSQAWTDTGSVTTKPTGVWTDTSGTSYAKGNPASVPGIGGCANANGPATSAGTPSVGGPAPYWQSYGYDSTGNRTQLVQHDVSGNTANDVTTTQVFGTPGQPNTGSGGPHALLSSTATSPSGGTKKTTFQYDLLGNTTAITDTSGTTTLGWTGEDQLASVARTSQQGGTSYLYDADGNQLIRRDPGKTTLELGMDELTLDTASQSLSDVRYYPSPGGLTITRVTAATGGGTLVYQAADPHGTNGVQIDTSSAQTVTRRPLDPFGNPRGTQPSPGSWSGDKGFVGGIQDTATGLTNLGDREYDPVHGRFLNPDPLLAATSPQQWNGYAYSGNDPVDSSDPTGLCPADICGVGTPIGGTGSSPSNPVRYVDTGPEDPDNPDAGEVHHGHYVPPAPKPTTKSNGGGKSGGGGWRSWLKSAGHVVTSGAKAIASGAQAVSQATSSGAQWAWNHRADIGQAVVETIVYSGCIGGSLAGAAETGGASLLAVAGCGAAAGAAGAATYDLLSPDGPTTPGGVFKDVATGAAFGAASGVLSEGASAVGKAVLTKAAPMLGDAIDSALSKVGRACANSFPAGTQVLLADGSTKAINTVAIGDQVASADPQTGQSSGEAVTQTIVTPDDQAFTDLTFAVDGSGTTPAKGAVTSTQHHPFWDVTTQRWTDAADLTPGDRIAVDAAVGTATVTTVHNYRTAPETAYNLTVEDLHTYFVVADGIPVLVHNDACPLNIHFDGDPLCHCSPPAGSTGAAGTRAAAQEMPMKKGADEVSTALKDSESLLDAVSKGRVLGTNAVVGPKGGDAVPVDHQIDSSPSVMLILGAAVAKVVVLGVRRWRG
ncbi:polymorphic toxin-type HINT domain-containing protein [Kitasatospora sp. NBC_01287]|uniref:RHS repeat-associated core domain-containing protein n=1 Tax=Kitasatospora sp. NBC_01287 TaxID=2903573 RepID=UPI002258BED1|nr:RHS repeat-associated core domain-containing protein [Kitasatospora sp. NBC_01287]MCX4749823.1 polymorphic toxin-type HINT domain-containing protein [Kitasatospora sp. NBC_01287]